MMKRKMLTIALVCAAFSAWAQGGKTGIDRSNLDLSVKPGDNFYQYAAGGWLKNHPLDAEHVSNGSFNDLDELNQKRIQELILQPFLRYGISYLSPFHVDSPLFPDCEKYKDVFFQII